MTGSGKTEVYLQVIQEALSRGKTAIMLVPEIFDTKLPIVLRFEEKLPFFIQAFQMEKSMMNGAKLSEEKRKLLLAPALPFLLR